MPWKPVKSIVAYYYMWKTTDRYQLQKRHRMMEKQNDLKEVIVHLRTSTGAPAGPRDLSGNAPRLGGGWDFYSHSNWFCGLVTIPGRAASAGPFPKTLLGKDTPVPMATDGEKGCESCHTTSASRWYHWGSTHEGCRLCNFCYTYCRKYGGLKQPSKWGE